MAAIKPNEIGESPVEHLEAICMYAYILYAYMYTTRVHVSTYLVYTVHTLLIPHTINGYIDKKYNLTIRAYDALS